MTAPSFGLWGSSNITESIILRSHKRKMTRVSSSQATFNFRQSGNIQDFFSIRHQDCKISSSLTEIHQCNNQRFHLKLPMTCTKKYDLVNTIQNVLTFYQWHAPLGEPSKLQSGRQKTWGRKCGTTLTRANMQSSLLFLASDTCNHL